MTEEADPQKKIATAISVVVEVMKAAGDVPEVKESAKNLGQTALTLTRAINNVLLPLAAVNYAMEKARRYFNESFQHDLEATASRIPKDRIVEPKASVAGPALQGLAFSHEEPSLREMYLSLLATAMDERIAEDAHPAFVEIIKQINSAEASLIRWLLRSSVAIPIVQIRAVQSKNQGHNVLLRHLLNLRASSGAQLEVNPRLPVMIDNLTRLGLIEVNYEIYLNSPELYAWVKSRPEFIQLRSMHDNENQVVEFQKGALQRTELGRQFALSVGVATS